MPDGIFAARGNACERSEISRIRDEAICRPQPSFVSEKSSLQRIFVPFHSLANAGVLSRQCLGVGPVNATFSGTPHLIRGGRSPDAVICRGCWYCTGDLIKWILQTANNCRNVNRKAHRKARNPTREPRCCIRLGIASTVDRRTLRWRSSGIRRRKSLIHLAPSTTPPANGHV